MEMTASTSEWAMPSEENIMTTFNRFILVLALACVGTANVAAATPKASPGGKAKVFLSVEEALELAFPEATIERESVYFSKEEMKRAAKLAKFELERGIARPYVAYRDGKLVGTAYFDNHKVRSLKETLMIVVDPEGSITRIEVLAFAEPDDYLPRASWYAQFKGKKLDDKLSLKGSIKGVTGATLTARATTKAARRTLAMHQVWHERPQG